MNCCRTSNDSSWRTGNVHKQGKYYESNVRGEAQPRATTGHLLDPRRQGKCIYLFLSSSRFRCIIAS